MLSQVNHWIGIGSVAIDAALLLRILQLKLQRTYYFITLACVLGLLFDGVAIWLGTESHESTRVFLYSRFLYAFVYPAAAYDVWEELKQQIGRIRNFAAFRLVTSLTLMAVLGWIFIMPGQNEEGGDTLMEGFALILWFATSTASFIFLWSMHRLARGQKLVLPNNTSVWLLFYQLLLAGEVVYFLVIAVGAQFNAALTNSLEISLNLYGVFITLWCIWKLRPLTSDLPSARENASP